MAERFMTRRRESGAAAVEFAIILPLVALLLFGVMQYGFYFWARSSAAAAVREAARRVSVGDFASCTDLQSFVTAEVGAARAGHPVTTVRSFAKGTDNLLPGTEAGDIMTMTVSFQSLDVGFIPLPQDGLVSTTATSRVESVRTPPPGGC